MKDRHHKFDLPFLLVLCIVVCRPVCSPAFASDPTTAANRPGLQPFGSYSGNGPDGVNLSNGNLVITIPLLELPGRAGHNFTVQASYNSKMWKSIPSPDGSGYTTAVEMEEFFNERNDPPRIGWMIRAFPAPVNVQDASQIYNSGYYPRYRFRANILMPDGSRHLAHYSQTDLFLLSPPPFPSSYRTVDGSFMTYFWNRNTVDQAHLDFVRLKNGAQLPQKSPLLGLEQELLDAQGNSIRVRTESAGTGWENTTYTDTVGRKIVFHHKEGDPDWVETIQVFDDQNHVIKSLLFRYTSLHLWPRDISATGNISEHRNVDVLQEIVLPNLQTYTFEYDSRDHPTGVWCPDSPAPAKYSTAALTRITYPTGGYSRYEYRYSLLSVFDEPNWLVARRFISRPGGGEVVYSYDYASEPFSSTVFPENHTGAGIRTVVTRPVVTQSVYPYNQDTYQDVVRFDEDGYEIYHQTLQNGAPLLTVEKKYQFEVDSGSGDVVGTGEPLLRHNVRLLHERVILPNNTQSQTSYAYDRYGAKVGDVVHTTGNTINKLEYALGSGGPGAAFRSTSWDYLHRCAEAPCSNSNPYSFGTGQRHILDRPTYEQVSEWTGGSWQLKSWTSYEYDTPGYLSARSGAFQHDDANFSAAQTLRGNPVRLARHRNAQDMNGISESVSWYDTLGNVIKMQDALGRQTSYNYADDFVGAAPGRNSRNSDAYLTTITPPAASPGADREIVTRRYYYDSGLMARETDPRGKDTVYTYDVMDRPKSVTRPDGGVTASTYSDATRIVDVTQSLDPLTLVRTRQEYDVLGRLAKTTRFNTKDGNSVAEQQYDDAGRLWKVSNPYTGGSTSDWTTTRYDALDRVTDVFHPDGSRTTTSYAGQFTVTTDPAGKKRRTEQDSAGRLVNVWEDFGANNYLTAYTYDALNNLTQVDQGGQQRTFVYDGLSRLASETSPETGTPAGNGTTTYHYYDNGLVSYKTDPRSAVTTFRYDELNRLTSKSYTVLPDGLVTPEVAYSYGILKTEGNRFGRLKTVATGTGNYTTTSTSYTFDYDDMGRVSRQTASFTSLDTALVSNYTWDHAGNLRSIQYPSGRLVTPSFDDSGHLRDVLSSRTSTGKYVGNIYYWPHGAVRSATFGNTLSFSSTYNSRLQPLSLAVAGRMQFNYAYGSSGTNNGNILVITDGIKNYEYRFDYDGLNRIKAAYGTGHAVRQDFSYDAWGNILRDPETQALYSYIPGKNRRQDQGIGHDDGGNVLTEGGHSYTYDAENRIVLVDGDMARYEYDGQGRRVKRTVRGLPTYYVHGPGGEVLSEFVVNISLASSLTAAPASDVATNYFHADPLGTPRLITAQSGGEVSRHDYYPFGKEIPRPSYPDGETHQFTGKERDAESGLDYFGARYFSSTEGRFTSIDPLSVPRLQKADREQFAAFIAQPQNWNAYAYAHNNPIGKLDPNGLITYVISGTRSDLNDWQRSDFVKAVAETFHDEVVVLNWGRGDTDHDRHAGAEELKRQVANHEFKPGEKLNIVAHSHGGNVAFYASGSLGRPIDMMVTLGTPIRPDYQPASDRIARHLNVFSEFDFIQQLGGIRMSYMGRMVLIPAERTLEGEHVRNLDASGYAKGHSELWTNTDTWYKVVVPALRK